MPPRKRQTTDDDLDHGVEEVPALDDVRDRDVVDYDSIGSDDDYPPFRFKLGGQMRELQWPTASTKRAIITAMQERRIEDLHQLLFGSQWPAVSEAIDDLGAAGDEAAANLVADALEHIGMSEAAGQHVQANRQQRREQRKQAARGSRRRGRP